MKISCFGGLVAWLEDVASNLETIINCISKKNSFIQFIRMSFE